MFLSGIVKYKKILENESTEKPKVNPNRYLDKYVDLYW